MNIKLHEKRSYPDDIKKTLKTNSSFLKNRREFNNIQENDYCKSDKTEDPERNICFEKEYNQIKKSIEFILIKHKVSVFHYTRLTKNELKNISKERYLNVPSEKNFFLKKIRECEEIPEAIRESLANDIQKKYDDMVKSDPQDKNKICFTYEEIKEDSDGYLGIEPFLKKWGGEFLFRDCATYFEKESVDLSTIGTPYQFEIEIDVEINNVGCFADMLLKEECKNKADINSNKKLKIISLKQLNLF